MTDPFYFRGLFGVLHPTAAGRDVGALLCYPAGREYERSHRTYRLLAGRLAAAGVPTLRFDFTGCGDSTGEPEDGTLAQWRQDVAVAAGELRSRTGAVRAVVLGTRLGGTAACLAATEVEGLCGLVLWDPVVRGAPYQARLRQLRDEVVARVDPALPAQAALDADAVGLPLGAMLGAELDALDLVASPPVLPDVPILVEEGTAAQEGVGDALAANGRTVTARRATGFGDWLDDNKTAVAPPSLTEAAVRWIRETCA